MEAFHNEESRFNDVVGTYFKLMQTHQKPQQVVKELA
jgi:hypothetical protein